MTYRISYDVIYPTSTETGTTKKVLRMEYFHTEQEALNRARELLEAAEHRVISVVDSAGNVCAGFRLDPSASLKIAS